MLPAVLAAAVHPAALQWGSCYFPIAPEWAANYQIECATLRVPLDYAEPAGEQIDAHLTSLIPLGAARGNVTEQWWWIEGGPGNPGTAYLPMVATPPPAAVGLDGVAYEFVLWDHRGTGGSAELMCPEPDTYTWPVPESCKGFLLRNAARVRQYTISNAARDLKAAMDAARESTAVRQKLLATSYGTSVAQRFVQIYPTRAAAVEMDSICNMVKASTASWESTDLQDVVRRLLSLCAADAGCAAEWGGAGRVADGFRETVYALRDGTQRCAAKHFPELTVVALRRALYSLMFEGDSYFTREAVPAAVLRLRRCRAADVAALTVFLNATNTLPHVPRPRPPRHLRQSAILNQLIQISEMWWDPARGKMPSAATVAEWERDTLVSSNSSAPYARLPEWGFPLYTPDKYYRKYQTEQTSPVVLLNGDLDTNTKFERAADVAAHSPGWPLVRLPLFGHSSMSASALAFAHPADPAAYGFGLCPFRLAAAFLRDPAGGDPAARPGSCYAAMPRDLHFTVASSPPLADVARAYFGTATLYGD